MGAALAGQTAIVTGGGRGIGRIIAEALAAAGAAVAVVARSEAEVVATATAIAQHGGRGLAQVADVCDADAVAAMVREVERRLGPVNLLVNNAGTGEAIGPTWETAPDRWWRDVEVVLRGAFLCSRAVLAGMVERGSGRIVNVTSRAGSFGVPYQTAYSSSRAALFLFSEGLAREVAEHGIRVFALTPGIVRTAMTENLLHSEAGRRWLPELAQIVEGDAGWVAPDVVGAAVTALASGRADALSGRWIHAEDDLEVLVARAGELALRDLHVLRLKQ
jgi:NAD(P)-dependent dehydrogenase (short-subunit alcohol dehydrogenase family)